jgi:hypothetical protein
MTEFRVLIRMGRTDRRIVRLYSLGHDSNLAAWEEEAAEKLSDICFNIRDPGDCHLVGEARWLYMRFTKSNAAVIKPDPFKGAEAVTMQRVHRNNTPRRKR